MNDLLSFGILFSLLLNFNCVLCIENNTIGYCNVGGSYDSNQRLVTSTTIIDSALAQLHFASNSQHDKIYFVVSEKHTLYRSVDDGKTWTAVNGQRQSNFEKNRPSTDVDYLLVSPSNNSIIFIFAVSEQHHYV
jgi:photosystem II stability/assembly factor-like uncharacterized protein